MQLNTTQQPPFSEEVLINLDCLVFAKEETGERGKADRHQMKVAARQLRTTES